MNKHMKKADIMYYVAACLLPNIFLFYLFNSNKAQNDFYFSHFLVLAGLLSLVSFLILLIYKKITHGCEPALIALLVSWMLFWLFEAIVAATIEMFGYYIRRMAFLAVAALIISALLLLLRKFGEKLTKARTVFLALSGIICLLFIFNFSEAVYTDVITRILVSRRAQLVEHKTDYVVDESLKNPDIYWLHMDEMMGFDGVEKYFGDSLDELREELLQRGFIIKEDATLNAGRTQFAIPALLSPFFYDNYLREYLDMVEHLPRPERDAQIHTQFAKDGINRHLVTNMELFHAFLAKNYHQVTQTDERYRSSLVPLGWYYTEDEDYLLTIGMDEDSPRNFWYKVEELVLLLCQTTPLARIETAVMAFVRARVDADTREWLSIPEHTEAADRWTRKTQGLDEERLLIRRLHDSFSIPSPKLVYVINDMGHDPYDKIYKSGELEHPVPGDTYNAELLYVPQYKYVAQVMLNTIDMILEQNPEAIIVVQGDHGIHNRGRKWLVRQGYPPDQVNEINYSVLSAVRIPEAFGGLEEPVEPLNITRLLVNRYVGENYEYLTD